MIKKALFIFEVVIEKYLLGLLLWLLFTLGCIITLCGGMTWAEWFIGSGIILGFLYLAVSLKKPTIVDTKHLLTEAGSDLSLLPELDNLNTLMKNLNNITTKKKTL